MRRFTKVIPNIITSIRIIGAIVLIFLEALSIPFIVIYAVCGASDALDGFTARKFNASSKFGSILDSASDLIFYTILAVKIFPVMYRLLNVPCWVIIIIPICLHALAYIICALKFKKFSAIHTYANKCMSFMIFFFPFTFIGEIEMLYTIYVYVCGPFAIYSGLEMILIHLLTHQYNEKNKSIFFVKRNEKELEPVVEQEI